MKRMTPWLGGATLVAAIAVATPASADPAPPPPDPALVVEAFEVPRNGDLLVLPVTIAGQLHWFALYTGATNSVFDQSLRKLLGQPVGASGASSGEDRVPVDLFAWPKDAYVGRIPLTSRQPVALTDLSTLRRTTGYEIHGLLGMDFLKGYTIRVDFDAGKLWFLRSAPADSGKRIAVRIDESGLPTVCADLGDGPQDCVVNTGSIGLQAGELTSVIIDALVVREKARLGFDGGTAFFGGRDAARHAMVGNVNLGGFEHANLAFAESAMNMLGLGYWSRYVVTFDFPGGYVYLSPGSRYDRGVNPSGIGLGMTCEERLTFVESIKRGSPAARSGLRLGDLLLNVAGRSAQYSSVYAITSALGDQDVPKPVLVQRQGVVKILDWPAARPINR